ncbi:MAG: TetR/AcrR family transcriptional regulator [Pseudomonadota bacterium]
MDQDTKPEGRKAEIVMAAATLLKEHGEAGFSLREVAKVVGMKLASLQYHFPNKAELMTEILNFIMDAYLAEIEAAVASAGDDPVEQLKSAARALSGLGEIEEDDGRLEIHLWSMALTDSLVRKTMDECHKFYIDKMSGMIAAANSTIDAQEAKKRAVLIASLQEGSMLFMDEEVTGLSLKSIGESVCQATIKIALA